MKLTGWLLLSLVTIFAGSALFTTALVVNANDIYYIAFVSDRNGNEDIFAVPVQGGESLNLTSNPARDWHPSWSPDGRQIAFASNRDGNDEIYVLTLIGGALVNITQSPNSSDTAPAWSPDGSQIAFVSDRSGGYDLYLFNKETGEVTRLTEDGVDKGAPAWSPSGGQISYWSIRDGQTLIFSVDTVTHNRQLITNSGPNNWPAWSRDGQNIAFDTERNGAAEIYITTSSGGDGTNITNNPAADFRPAWSANGEQIAFNSDRAGNLEIYVMSADGSNVIRLTDNPAADHSPDWQPRPFSQSESGEIVAGQSVGRVASLDEDFVQEEIGEGNLVLRSPEQVRYTEPFVIRVDLTVASRNFPTPTPASDSLTAALPVVESYESEVYNVMGARIIGFPSHLSKFEFSPGAEGYMIEVRPDRELFWEWDVLPIGLDAVGSRELKVEIFAPEDDQGNETIIYTFDVNIEVTEFAADFTQPTSTPTAEPLVMNNALVFEDVGDGVTSVILVVNGTTDIRGLTLNSRRRVGDFQSDFDILADPNVVVEPGMCFRYTLGGAEPAPLPRACETVFELPLSAFDAFWFEGEPYFPVDVIVLYNGHRVIVCSAAVPVCEF